jgi:hypothetical protein
LTADPERRRLTDEQIGLIREVVTERAPHLTPVVDRLRLGQLIPGDEIAELSDVITQVMSEETDEAGSYNERGLALDDLIGFVWQRSEDY